jgi:hypothetical protein
MHHKRSLLAHPALHSPRHVALVIMTALPLYRDRHDCIDPCAQKYPTLHGATVDCRLGSAPTPLNPGGTAAGTVTPSIQYTDSLPHGRAVLFVLPLGQKYLHQRQDSGTEA